jgi:hypothetical protein
MSFSVSKFTMDRQTCPMMATELHPLKPNGQKKLGAHDRISSIQQSPSMKRPVEFAGGAF